MTKREFEIGFVNKKTAIVCGFYLPNNVYVLKLPKQNKKGKYSFNHSEGNIEPVYFQDSDSLWEYQFNGTSIKNELSKMEGFYTSNEDLGGSQATTSMVGVER